MDDSVNMTITAHSKLVAIAVVAIIVVAGVGAYIVLAGGDSDTFDENYQAPESTRLWIYGNADMNDTLNGNDLEYLKRIVSGEKDETMFADANYDGKVDEADVTYLETMLSGDTNIKKYYVQDDGKSVSFVKGVTEKLGIKYNSNVYAASVLGALDMLMLSDDSTLKGLNSGSYGTYLQTKAQNGEIGTYGSGSNDEYDLESMYKTGVDSILASSASYYFTGIEDKMTDSIYINIIRIGVWKMDNPEIGILTIAYLLNDKDIIANAHKYVDWVDKIDAVIEEKTSKIDQKRSCLIICPYDDGTMEVQGDATGCYEASLRAGINNLAFDMPGYYDTDVETVVAVKNPEFVFIISGKAAGWDRTQEDVNTIHESLDKWFKTWDTYKENDFAYTTWSFSEGVFQPVMGLMMCHMVYGDLFDADFDPLDYLQEFVDEFMPHNVGLEPGSSGYRDVHEQGIYLGQADA